MNPPGLLALTVAVFGFSWWLGLYLLARDPADPALRFAGLGLGSYALGLAADLLSRAAPTPLLSQLLARWGWPLLLLPALFWFGALLFILPESATPRRKLARLLDGILLPVAMLIYLLAGGTELVVTISDGRLQPAPLYPFFALLVIGLLVAALIMVLRSHRRNLRAGLGAIVLATVFFGLGTGLLLFPLAWLPWRILALAIGADLALLGLAIALLDALDQGEALLPDLLRSLGYAGFTALLFGGQVALIMALASGVTFPMVVLLLAIVAAAIAIQTLADPLQAGLDRLLFARLPRVRQARTEARTVARGATRGREALDVDTLSQAQLTRLTRRALSQMGNLPKLAASPLTRLPLLEARLRRRGAADNTLERAAELKAVLAESIARLKPRDKGEFGVTDEWRHYNALYFPYVVGLRPYSRRADHGALDGPAEEALNWFRTQVPERTLYNWQTAAARLVAQDLREQAQRAR